VIPAGRTTHALQLRSFLAWVAPTQASGASANPSHDATGSRLVVGAFGRINYALVPRHAESTPSDESGRTDFLLGDSADIDARAFLQNSAAGVPIRFDATAGTLNIATSIVGMPTIYLYRENGITAVTSDIHLLRVVPGARLELDPRSVCELGQIGHPVEHRTLFRNVMLVESGARLQLNSAGDVSVETTWSLPDTESLTWPQFLEAQIEAFKSAVAATNVSESFLSLTAGLDTRTVFSTLAAQQRLLPAATMSGVRMSLDAMIARRLCQHYGVEHMVITYAQDYVNHLPEYLRSASLLSGGLASLAQSPEVHMYRAVGPRFGARLSGNLGNQVGRGGTEGVSVRGAEAILDSRFIGTYKGQDEHWLLRHLNASRRSRMEFILRNETVFTSVGNYSVGNHFAVQQSPYGSRQLIETLAQQPDAAAGLPSGSRLRMRLRDLRHRFIGEPEERSFQRKLVRRQGGFAAECPINWGWRPKGGVSPTDTALGAATLVGMYARAKGWDAGVLRGVMKVTGLPGLHDFRESDQWLRDLRGFVTDTITARAVMDAGLFDAKVLHSTLENHFAGRVNAFESIVFALDLALCYQLFCAAQ
jgi:hypothetical protein